MFVDITPNSYFEEAVKAERLLLAGTAFAATTLPLGIPSELLGDPLRTQEVTTLPPALPFLVQMCFAQVNISTA